MFIPPKSLESSFMSFSFDILTILILSSGLLVVCERLGYMYVSRVTYHQ